MTFATTNPYTGEVLKTFPEASEAEVKEAIGRADSSPNCAAGVMQKAADILRRDIDTYAPLLTLEMGKLLTEAKAEVELSASIFEYYAQNAETLLTPEKFPVADPAEGEAIAGVRAARRSARDRAVELPLLPDRPHPRAAALGRQHAAPQACRQRAAMRGRVREADARSGAARWRLHQSLCDPRCRSR